MKKGERTMKYEKPEVDVIIYENVDIITLSGGEPILPPVPTGCQNILNLWDEAQPK